MVNSYTQVINHCQKEPWANFGSLWDPSRNRHEARVTFRTNFYSLKSSSQEISDPTSGRSISIYIRTNKRHNKGMQSSDISTSISQEQNKRRNKEKFSLFCICQSQRINHALFSYRSCAYAYVASVNQALTTEGFILRLNNLTMSKLWSTRSKAFL